MPKVIFNRKADFFNSLKKSVDNYFTTNDIKKTGNWELYAKTLVLVPMAITLYVSVLIVPMHWAIALGLCVLFAVVAASIGFNVMHDACHGSYSSKKWVNDLVGLSINALGGNAYIWKFKHNVIHHTYTNIEGLDDDIHKHPILRMCSSQSWKPAHQFQYIYMFGAYALSSITWMLMFDYIKYFSRKIVVSDMPAMTILDHVTFWVSKALYLVFYIGIPIYFVGTLNWFIGFMAMHAVLGLILAIVFQLAHVVEETKFETAHTEEVHIANEWAVHQLSGTANFARDDKFISWYVGGLNYQIEHHLFPRISHVHYPALSEIVKAKCEEFGIDYNESPTMWTATLSHIKLMKELGKKPVVAVAA